MSASTLDKAWNQLKRIKHLMSKVNFVKECLCHDKYSKKRRMQFHYILRCQQCGGKITMEEFLVNDGNTENIGEWYQ